jgi:hypothetical protein
MTKRRNLDLSNAGSYFDSTGKLNLIAGTNVSISSTDSSFTISATDTNTTYTNVSEFTNDANYLDSTTVQGVIDASYIQANQTTYTNVSEFVNDANYLDSTTVQGVIDATYIQANQTTYNTSDFLDSTTVANVVDAAYVQARQITYNTSDFVDSAYVTTQINNLIGSAPGTLDTLEEIANALNNDSQAYSSLVKLINGMADSDWVQSLPVSTFTNDANYLDSTTAVSVITANEANAFGNIAITGQTTVTADNANDTLNLVGNNGIRIITDAGGNEIDISFVNSANYLDSTTVLDVVDATYIQANQTTYTNVSEFTNDANYISTGDSASLSELTVTGNLTGNSLRADNLTTQNAFVIVGDSNNLIQDTTLSVDPASNYLGINQTSPEVTLHMTGEGAQTAQIRMEQYNNSADAPDVRTRRYRGTISSPSAIQSGDYLFRSNHEFYNGSALIVGGQFAFDNTNNANRTQFTVAVTTDGTSVEASSNDDVQFKIDGNDSGAITFNNAYKFPTSDGTTGQFLKTNGEGTLSFDSISIPVIDSAYIEARRPAETIFGVVNNGSSAYTFSGDGFPSTVDNPTLYLARGKTYKFSVNASSHPFQIRLSDGGSAYSDGVTNNGAQVGDVIFTVPMNAPNSLVYQCTVHSGMVGDIVIFNENSFLDSSTVTGVIDATYIQANQTTYTNVSEFTNDANYLDSTTVQNVIDASYIQANQITYSTADFPDSAGATTLANTAITSAIGSTVQALLVSGTNIKTVNGNSLLGSGDLSISGGGSGTLDSTTVLDVIDNHLNTGTAGAGEVLSWTGSDYDWVAQSSGGGLDSALVIDLIDSAYVQARQSAGGSTTVGTLGVTTYTYEADSGDTIFSGTDVNGATLTFASSGLIQVFRNGVLLSTDDYTASSNTVTLTFGADSADVISISAFGGYQSISGRLGIDVTDSSAVFGQTVFARTYTPGKIMVFRNGVLLKDSDDYTATNGTSITLVSAADSNDYISISEFIGDNGIDSATAISLATALPISTFTNDANYLDSTTVQGVINAAYIQANQTTYSNVSEFTNDANYLDSTTVTGVINASYIQSNQTTYSTADFLDSVHTLALLANNDITIGAVVETYSAIGASDIDLSTANYFSKTISGTTTFTVSNVASSGNVSSFILELTNGGSATVNWFSGVTWAAATAPTLTTSGLDILGFFTRDGGTTWRGLVLAQAVA